MHNTLMMPTYNQLVKLPDVELIKRVGLALGQLDEAEDQGESKTDKARIYQAYKNELTKRNYRQRTH
jgi:hypothetical protein